MKTRFASQFHFFNPLPLTSVAVLLLFLQASSAQTQNTTTADYDAARDFSIISNPNGVWSYGWISSLGSPLNLYTVKDTTSVSGISAWLRSGTYYIDPPLIAHNDTDSVICVPVCVPPALLNVHPGPNDEVTVVRWTAPTSGNFFFQGVVVGLDRGGPTTTGFYLVHNSSDILFSTQIKFIDCRLRFITCSLCRLATPSISPSTSAKTVTISVTAPAFNSWSPKSLPCLDCRIVFPAV